MANEKNLRRLSTREAREIGRKGGEKSVKVRREKKMLYSIINKFLDSDIEKYPQIRKLASKVGIDEKESVKYLFTFVGLLNSLEKADLKELETLMRILGEKTGNDSYGKIEALVKGLLND
ncbi:MAG: hypothetical protein IJE10_04930 [Clostridia bacterium]|nr:hypothetical protein [Clostridia bacterium]